jgi:hypothetical protein
MTTEMESLIVALRKRLDTDPRFDTPLGRLVANYVAATVKGVQDGELGETHVANAIAVCREFERLRESSPSQSLAADDHQAPP